MESEIKKILIIEDDLSIRKALAMRIDEEGMQVKEAENGKKGLEITESWEPDIILLDILMPEMNGLETMKKMRAMSEYGKKVPIIILTNVSPDDNSILQQVAELTPSYYFVKGDIEMDRILEKIKEIGG